MVINYWQVMDMSRRCARILQNSHLWEQMQRVELGPSVWNIQLVSEEGQEPMAPICMMASIWAQTITDFMEEQCHCDFLDHDNISFVQT